MLHEILQAELAQVYAEQETVQRHHEVLKRGTRRFEIQFLRMMERAAGLETLPEEEKIERLKEIFEIYGPRGIYVASVGLLPTDLVMHPDIASPSRLMTTFVERPLTPPEIRQLTGTVCCYRFLEQGMPWEQGMPSPATKLLLADLKVCAGICILSNPRDKIVGHAGQLYRASQQLPTFYDFGLPEEEITEIEGTVGFELDRVTRRVVLDNKAISHCVGQAEVQIRIGQSTLMMSSPAPVFIQGWKAQRKDYEDLLSIINSAQTPRPA